MNEIPHNLGRIVCRYFDGVGNVASRNVSVSPDANQVGSNNSVQGGVLSKLAFAIIFKFLLFFNNLQILTTLIQNYYYPPVFITSSKYRRGVPQTSRMMSAL